MDKTALGMLILGLILLIAGVYGAYYFLDELIFVIKGLLGLVVALVGVMLLVVGILTIKD
ncbi:hypothetical protein L1994_03770 [Methanomicrobium antiquum]|uniref:Uncharacterized protein n=1 Tax=Methanomicrobium antiquum TaxID=487686 RepID=A0AAF0FPX9_9EURY|nr:hypothetical protein [Methanomicrobium antiquum]MDD3976570.1 hypothetical protein [Methanomicrobium sp.]WFN37515.1 hypothetical protein L1994_03770 [Methanomicrobium antiquum]